MNLRPAPFALTPQLIGRVLDALPTRSLPVSPAVRPSLPPVEADGPIEPARCPPMQATPPAPAERIAPAFDRPGTYDPRASAADRDVEARIARVRMTRGSAALLAAIQRARSAAA